MVVEGFHAELEPPAVHAGLLAAGFRRFAHRVVIEPVDPGVRVPYQVDGDPIMALPVSVEVDPRTLLVRIPHPTS